MEQVKGYNKLPPRAQEVFQKVYKKHLASMGVEEKKKHSVDNLKAVKVNAREKCLEAHFAHDWYKYYPNGTWG